MPNKPNATIRILALDISSCPGLAVVEVKNGKMRLLHVDSAKTDSDNKDAERYAYIEALVTRACYEYGPFDVVCREHFTKGRSKRATQTVFGAWAAVDLALSRFSYVIDSRNEFTPSAVKKAATGDGKAGKADVEAGVRARFNLAPDFTFKTDDESDAAATALAWIDANMKEAE